MPKRLPALDSLRFLEAGARHANFTRAADELGVTPAAVSLRIRDLEAELGVALFRRSGPAVTPTEAGAALAGRVAKALGLLRAAVEECRGTAEPLRVTAVPTFAMRWLTPRLAAYHASPDAVPIRLDVSAELRPAEGFDIAIRTGPGDWPGFEATALMPVDATAMLSPALAAGLSSPADLAALRLLPHPGWPRWFREAGVEAPALRFYADDYPTHELDAAAAIEGAGVALLSPRLFAPLLRDGKLVQPFPHIIRGPAAHYLLLWPGEARPAVLHFRDWLADEARRPDGGLTPVA
ncbi:LysR substrate-binding domain-containing protein [Inquilinus sp.]|jgi:LysR family glycine cleavage system transcriptional activator|uniref:LysR substrate-binding domain-containing protein n=1 Tax=Inquilinus sp. TaxID=1932117 RepID=UPI003783B0FC